MGCTPAVDRRILVMAAQFYHADKTNRHVVALITGAVLPLILLTPVHELVGVVALVLLVGWRKRVLSEIGMP